MQPDILGTVFRSLVSSLPSIVVYSVGIIFALVQMRKAPKAAVIVVISLIVMGLVAIVQPIVFVVIGRVNNPTNWLPVFSLVFRFVFLAAIAGLILAVFCDRSMPTGIADPYPSQFGKIASNPNPYAAPQSQWPQQ